ncbi:hypothetical protein [Actinoplanes awajinensis]|uniref:Cell wall anchor protein n=1 Tax=Actinoplanes awajinensis subsp. mycoplanecinus TaxID=135947 RepID=A0A0X3V6Z2_9ACTN|nr:hypothetical protein [Actinoplanes awajinensis]KUL40573.1 hypothetical protein ADL15_06165 [Actinoplanes awajinensis subsp. mycoplanecinus]
MKKARFLRAALVLVSAVLGAGTVATASHAASLAPCVSENFSHTDWKFENGKAEISATMKDACAPQEVTLVTYLAPKPNFDVPQYLFAKEKFTFAKQGASNTFKVDLPNCNTQADLFLGGDETVIPELVEGGLRYDKKKIAYWNGGTSNCVQPAVQYTTACDGSTLLNLSNNGTLSAYGVDFTVKYGTETKVVKVAKGASEDLTVPAGSGKITVTADKLETTTIDWALPENCKPSATAVNDCKVTTVTVNNPAGNGDVPAEVTYNGKTKTVTVPSGKSQTVTFDSATATTSATVKFPETRLQDITVEVTLGECAEPQPSTSASTSPPVSLPPTAATSPSASASTSTSPAAATPSASKTPGGELALTGAAGGSIAGGAVLLLIVGAGLFFMARRRKVNFKA